MAAVCFDVARVPAKHGRDQRPRAVILQMLPPKDIPASSARRTLIREKVNRERWSEGKAGERYTPCVEVLSLMRDINK